MFKEELVNTSPDFKGVLKKDILILDDFFPKDYANKLYTSLYNIKEWNSQDTDSDKELAKFNFGYRRKQLELVSDCTPEILSELNVSLNTQHIFDWVANLSGCEVNGFVGAASWLRGGNYLAAHNDCGDPRRRVTFNYYLTRNWKQKWGGLFVYDNPRKIITPTFNSLILFKVGDHSWHSVTPVSKMSPRKNKRLAITGWFYQQ